MRSPPRRRSHAVLRPNKRMRDKWLTKPSIYRFEVCFLSLDQVAIGTYGANSASKMGARDAAEIADAIRDFRAMAGGRFKIVTQETLRKVRTRIYCEREADVILLGMLASRVIYRVYRLLNPQSTASHPPAAR